jgi:hypothetical protein
MLELISEKLSKNGYEPVIAVRERAYGQDIFCTKICGRIIESRFCLVILDDKAVGATAIPNPNVYYEYGLMTAMNKHVIPLQKDDMTLAFNIQSYDTVKYTPANTGTELNRAIKEAIRLAEGRPASDESGRWSDRLVMRCIELAGYEPKDSNWFLDGVVVDTNFVGFGHRDPKHGYVFLAKVDGAAQVTSALEDIPVLVYRAEAAREALEEQRITLAETIEERKTAKRPSYDNIEAKLAEATDRLGRMSHLSIGIVAAFKCDTGPILAQAQQLAKGAAGLGVSVNSGAEITLGEVRVSLEYPSAAAVATTDQSAPGTSST